MVARRQFLQRLGAMAAVGLTASGCNAGPAYDVPSLAQPELLATLGIGEVRNIGQRYRALNRAEADASALRNAILNSRPIAARLGLMNPSIATLVQADFEHGRTVVLDGWLLSVTEARQCALLSSLTV